LPCSAIYPLLEFFRVVVFGHDGIAVKHAPIKFINSLLFVSDETNGALLHQIPETRGVTVHGHRRRTYPERRDLIGKFDEHLTSGLVYVESLDAAIL
jgi:hypothetical protein